MLAIMKQLVQLSSLALLLVAGASPAAQRVDENAVADAEDAFGSNVGGEDLGIYGPFDVRGFSPTDAGNIRLEGLYLDRQAELTSRLVAGNRIRIGPSALGYAFPAPSGIADYRLRAPQGAAVLSLALKADHFGASSIEADALLPIDGARLGLAGGIGVYRNVYAFGNNADVLSTALVGVWRPGANAEIKPFWSRIRISDEEAQPIVRGDGRTLPPPMTRRRFLGQRWADFEVERLNYGGIGRAQLGGFALSAGLFRSANINHEGYTLLIDAATPARRVIADPPRFNRSASGEINVVRAFDAGGIRHELMAALRARRQERRFGGSARAALAPAPLDAPLLVPRPELLFGAQSDDRVRQWTVGLAYQARARFGQLNAGLQRSDYRKTVRRAQGDAPASADRPWLFNFAAAVPITEQLSVYGGMTRGLEESDVAPETAVNRDEAPPAIRTRQVDGGLRWQIGPMLLIAGAFEIEKPYYGLDAANVFRRLGEVTHRGIEASLSGSPTSGLTWVAGGVLLDARLAGEEVAAGRIGRRPAGTPARTLVSNFDWRPGGTSPFSADLAIEHRGRQYADAANLVAVPARTIFNLGARYRFSVARVPAVLRLQATNVFDTHGWEVAGNNAFTYIEGRRVIARLVLDL